ncbi:MAG: hypothetical protein R3D58_00930 [Saprospiraceae bacterium]|jgi:hypothetical protein
MKKTVLLPLGLCLLFAAGCDDDPFPIELERYDVFWADVDQSGTRTPNDELDFDIVANTTDPDADDQFITEWEFSYRVNGTFVGVLQSDTGLRSNTLSFTGTTSIKNLPLPFTGGLQPGDQFEFRFYAIDNHGTFVERFYVFTLE